MAKRESFSWQIKPTTRILSKSDSYLGDVLLKYLFQRCPRGGDKKI
jgi:hypothetical protein